MGHESDAETDAKLIEINNIKKILDDYSRELKTYQTCIGQLNMVVVNNDDGGRAYVLPKNAAGNEIDADYRTSMKSDLIKNIDTLLTKLNGFLPQDTVESTPEETE